MFCFSSEITIFLFKTELVSHFFPTSVCALRVKNSSTGSFLSKLPLQDAAKGLPDTIASCFEPSEAHCDSTVKVNELDVNVPGDAEHQVFLNLDLDVTTIVGNVDEAGTFLVSIPHPIS